jgi:RNA polymerase sigma-70 factor, ECF subfamily
MYSPVFVSRTVSSHKRRLPGMNPSSRVNENGVRGAVDAESEEDRLLTAARTGNSLAFATLVTRHRGLVLTVIRRMIRNPVEAEDLTQQAFLKAYLNLRSFVGRSTFSTWLVSIARNEARMWSRKKSRSHEVAMVEFSLDKGQDAPLQPDFMDWRPGPEAVYLQKESTHLLLTAMESLSPLNGRALRLCDLDEEPIVTAALLLGVSVGALKSRRVRGRLALRRSLESGLHGGNRSSHKQDLSRSLR